MRLGSRFDVHRGPPRPGIWFAAKNSWELINTEKKTGFPLKASGETGPTAMKENTLSFGCRALCGSLKD